MGDHNMCDLSQGHHCPSPTKMGDPKGSTDRLKAEHLDANTYGAWLETGDWRGHDEGADHERSVYLTSFLHNLVGQSAIWGSPEGRLSLGEIFLLTWMVWAGMWLCFMAWLVMWANQQPK